MQQKISTSEEESQQTIIQQIIQHPKKHIICLHGELGVGKTTTTQGIAKHFGITQHIQSPTFTLYKSYQITGNNDYTELCHVDAYRLTNETNIQDIGIQEYLDNQKILTLIEWPDNISSLLNSYKDSIQHVYIEHGNHPHERIIQFT